ncbi:hypothetical protein K456DRAFT_43961 [Colletotrichum gloeosporioides 23]|nr:hypothetical protein K456DRAFT_43961 [Colletotrichum gloeosporioides 23]
MALRFSEAATINTTQSLMSARSFRSDDTTVNLLAGLWSSGRSTATIASTAQEDLENAIISGDVVQVEALCLIGVALSEDRLFLLYEAYLRGPHIVNALALHLAHDFAGRISSPISDYVFYRVLRTPAIDFMNLWADGAGAALLIKEAVICLLLEKDIDFTL